MESYISDLADFLIELSNDALANSKVDMKFALAGLIPIQLDDMVSNSDALSAMGAAEPHSKISLQTGKHIRRI